jgi:hypothetical protein
MQTLVSLLPQATAKSSMMAKLSLFLKARSRLFGHQSYRSSRTKTEIATFLSYIRLYDYGDGGYTQALEYSTLWAAAFDRRSWHGLGSSNGQEANCSDWLIPSLNLFSQQILLCILELSIKTLINP